MVDVLVPEVRPDGATTRRIGMTPRRHRRPPSSLGRATALIVTGLAVLVWWGLAAFVSGPGPTDPDSPDIGLPPSGTPDVSAPANPPAGSPPGGIAGVGAGPRPPLPPALAPAPNRTDRPVGVQPAAPRAAVPQPAPQPAARPPAGPAPAPGPPVGPEPAPAPVPPVPSPAVPPPTWPPSATPPRGDGRGEHPHPTPDPHGPPRADQRYASCAEVLAAGLGPYKERRDVEYGWYPDLDGNGWVCEPPRWGPRPR